MKLKLDFDEMADDFFDNTRLMGIVAPVKNYQFCWQLNQLLRLDFRINNDIEIQLFKKQRNYYFSIFEYREPNSSLVHYLYNNQFDGEYLLPEFRHLDFLWLLKGDLVADDFLQNLLTAIKSINSVQLVTELTNEKIRNKGHLIF
ncbi:IPExxxVDY family protein [Paraflavitalea soli]|uniref:IPExxxVDY family protein n=1 Tax=Paraflavitalea soli TaxID=2315862 RepID=A0A3B7MUD5_9BACT|nr:IPExxxVDY family protein [Paraflavitalea soli]AXY76616.1 IPExxxVDY family protein [Paraflavitalea soli]